MLENSPLQRAHGGTCGVARPGIDEIGHRLGLREIDLVVEEGALGEFPRPRTAGAELDAAFDQPLHDDGSAMTLELDHVFAGIRIRAWEEQ